MHESLILTDKQRGSVSERGTMYTYLAVHQHQHSAKVDKYTHIPDNPTPDGSWKTTRDLKDRDRTFGHTANATEASWLSRGGSAQICDLSRTASSLLSRQLPARRQNKHVNKLHHTKTCVRTKSPVISFYGDTANIRRSKRRGWGTGQMATPACPISCQVCPHDRVCA